MDRSRILKAEFVATNEIRLNDRFADRKVILPNAGVVRGNNVAATREEDEPLHHPEQSGHSLWWAWTAERSAPVALSSAGTSFRNVIAVYGGDSLTGLTQVVAATSGEGTESRLWFNAVAGVTYDIAVDGLNGSTGTVELRLAQNEDFILEFLSPLPDASYAAPADIAIDLVALNTDLTVTQVNLFTNGVLMTRLMEPPFSYAISNVSPGVYQFDATAVDVYSRTAVVHGISAPVTTFRFATNHFFVSESNGVARIDLVRDSWSIPASVYAEMLPATATPGLDYEEVAGPVLFGQYYNWTSFTIPIFWDDLFERDETVEVVLRSGPGTPIKDRALLTIRNAAPRTAFVWVDDNVPFGTITNGLFEWVTNAPAPLSGHRAHTGESHGFAATNAVGQIYTGADGVLYQDVYLDPDQPPKMITMGWAYGNWYSGYVEWGDAKYHSWNASWMGPLPPTGRWARLAIPGSLTGNVRLEALQWSTIGGRAVWDRTVRVW